MYCILINLDKSEHGCVFHISDLFQYCAPVFKDLHVYPRSRGCRFSYFDAPRITLVLVFGTRTSSTYYTIKCTVVSVVHVRFVHDMACATLRLLKSVVSVHVKMQSFGTYNVQDVSRHLIRQENTFYPTQWR